MQPDENTLDKTRVFVVHGRNDELRRSMFEFLRSIGLKPIEWSQAIQMTGETAPFIGDILDAAFQQAQAVVVLLNGDDEARLRPEYHSAKMPNYEKDLTPQARPNVIFEAGLALGRFPKRTIIVEVGDLRPFSDIAGRHTIRINNSTKARQDLAQRLGLAGCKVDLSGTDWHQSGNFEIQNRVSALDVGNNPPNTQNKIVKENEFHPTQIAILNALSTTHSISVNDIEVIFKLSKPVALHFLKGLITQKYIKKTSGLPLEHINTHVSITDKGINFLMGLGKV